MKKVLLSIFCLLVLSLTAIPAGAQTRCRRTDSNRRYEQRYSGSRYRNDVYSGQGYDNRYSRDRAWDNSGSVWDRHRDKLTTAIGAGAGAVVGAAVGGKKGALIGAIAGGGGAALYTYKIRNDRRRY